MIRLTVLALLACLAIFFWMREGQDIAAFLPPAPTTLILAAAQDPVESAVEEPSARPARVLSSEMPLLPRTEPDLEPRPQPDPEIRYVSAAILRMRAGPSARAEIVGVYPLATPVTIEEQTGNWYRVTAPDGQTGWMAARYLSEGPAGGRRPDAS